MKLKKKAEETNKSTEEFLEFKKKKTWMDSKSGYKCFMLYPRSLYICWSHDEHWRWDCFKEVSEENIEVAKLSHVCWLEVAGKFKLSDLSPGVLYEIVYVVKLTNGAFGWEDPVKLSISLPADGKVQRSQRQVSLLEKPRGEWLELNLGSFSTEMNNNNNNVSETAEVRFDLSQLGGHWKSGLIIKGAIIRPKLN